MMELFQRSSKEREATGERWHLTTVLATIMFVVMLTFQRVARCEHYLSVPPSGGTMPPLLSPPVR